MTVRRMTFWRNLVKRLVALGLATLAPAVTSGRVPYQSKPRTAASQAASSASTAASASAAPATRAARSWATPWITAGARRCSQAYSKRPRGVGIGRPSSLAVSIHSRITTSALARASWYVGPSAAQPDNSGISAMNA